MNRKEILKTNISIDDLKKVDIRERDVAVFELLCRLISGALFLCLAFLCLFRLGLSGVVGVWVCEWRGRIADASTHERAATQRRDAIKSIGES